MEQEIRDRLTGLGAEGIIEEFVNLNSKVIALEEQIRKLKENSALQSLISSQLVMPASLETDYPKKLTIEALDPILSSASGFYACENSGSDEAFRWSGPTPGFNIRAMLNREVRLVFKLEVVAAHKNVELSSIQYCVGNGMWQYVDIIDGVIEGHIEPSSDPSTIIKFKYDLREDLDSEASGDARTLGIAVKRLVIGGTE